MYVLFFVKSLVHVIHHEGLHAVHEGLLRFFQGYDRMRQEVCVWVEHPCNVPSYQTASLVRGLSLTVT